MMEWEPVYRVAMLAFLVGIVFGLISALIAGFLPSRKAQKADPVEIIRGQ